MKAGENSLVPLINLLIEEHDSGPHIYRGRIISTSPLTVQPSNLDFDGSKKMPIVECEQLDFSFYIKGSDDTGHTRELKVGDEVLVLVFTDSMENYSKGKDFREDPLRKNSVDSSIIVGVIK
ncbi:hypothetical protein OXT66_05585 [Lentilactobacillus senioris]|uniref:hypothetical protein n=1 Tax=Lentilactobacillus senioris TaxID=931534 RepID=UPI0022828E54|nr:hypothetical protein [Lentilactobacillus senioris]MCY9807022.1 hypothetical protein [Lentilactobacillus senioris]